MTDLELLDELKAELDTLRPLTSAMTAKLREYYIVEWTHHSTAIEGNTLSLRETQVVLEGITVGGKTMREHLEIIDHRDAIDYVESFVQEEIPLTENFIRNVHHLVLKNTSPNDAGQYRRTGVIISGSEHKPPESLEVPAMMREMVEKYNTVWANKHPVYRAALLHWYTTYIHPFIDGNGRTARLLMNFSLMQRGYPPVIFRKERRLEYLDALELASVQGNMEPFYQLTAQSLIETTEIFLKVSSQ